MQLSTSRISTEILFGLYCMTSRYVLIHYHIFKNAGCSVDASLKASFDNGWAAFEGVHAHDVLSSRQLAGFLRANPHVRAVSSHLARPPLPWNGCLPVVFLRHPLLRARSVYEFTRRDSTQPFSQAAGSNDFAGYIRWALRRERGSIVIRNYQVVHLSEASWRCEDILNTEAVQGDLEQACILLEKWGVAGLVESFGLSMRVFQSLYGPALPEIRFENVHVNATVSTPTIPVHEQLEQCRQMLGTELYEDFMAANEMDAELHAHAKRILEKAAQIASIV